MSLLIIAACIAINIPGTLNGNPLSIASLVFCSLCFLICLKD
jgi:hypothetical protein